MKARKMICAAVVAVGMLALAACGGKDGDTTTAPETQAPAAETTAAPETQAPETQAPVETEAPTTEAAAAGAYKAGTYEAASQGYASQVKVTITIGDDGTITDCVIDASGETPGIGNDETRTADMQKEIVDANGELDAISSSSAAFTSGAVLKALQDCLSQAQ